MRIISQDGKCDYPYENSTLFIDYMDGRVIKIVPSTGYKDSNIATYSTEEKAVNAMEMLRKEYLKYMEIEGSADLTGQGVIQPNFWVLPKFFQFPQDDEIEVLV